MVVHRKLSVLGAMAFIAAAAVCRAAEPVHGSKTLSEWVTLLQNEDPLVRVDAGLALASMGPGAEPAVPALSKALEDEHAVVRVVAADALAAIGPGAAPAVAHLAEALKDKDAGVRAHAARALGSIGGAAQAASAALGAAVTDEDSEVRAQASWALKQVGLDAEAAAESTADGESGGGPSSSPQTSGTGAEAVYEGKTPAEWAELLKSTDPQARNRAATAFARLGPAARPAALTLADGLKLSDAGTRAACARALAGIGPGAAAAVPALIQTLRDDDAKVRAYAATALGYMGPAAKPAAAALQRALTDGDEAVRKQAGWAAERLQGVARAPEGAASLPDGVSGVRPEPAPGEGVAQESEPPAGEPSGAGEGGRPAGTSRTRGRRLPPPEGEPASTAQQPTYGGKTLGEWMGQLQSAEAGKRAEAADALGSMGPDAEPAVGPLNRARYDDDERVRNKAALALCKILGVALGDMLTKPKTPRAGGGQPEDSGPVPEGRVFYLAGVHEVSEDGVEPRPNLKRQSDTYRQYLFGFTNENLNYLDVAEAHRYREDARKRGLDVSQRLLDLLNSEPESEHERIGNTYKFYHSYTDDYIVRITCNQQTRYCYYRRVGNDWEWYGGGSHLGMTPGKYDAEITIWTRDGFRLDFKVPFTAIADVNPEEGDQAEASRVNSPQDIAKDTRQYDASLTPGDTDYTRRMYPGRKASAALEIGDRIATFLLGLADYQPMMPDDLPPYIREALTQYQRAAQVDPESHKPDPERLGILLARCAIGPTQESYALAMEIVQVLEARVADPELQGQEGAYGRALYERAMAYMSLADMVLAYRMDIDGFLRCWDLALQDRNLFNGTYADEIRRLDVGEKRLKWPQPGWWDPGADELQPPPIEGLPGDREPRPVVPQTEDLQLASAARERLEEALAKLDEERADQVGWLKVVGDKLLHAENEKNVALAKLDALRQCLTLIERKKTYLNGLLGASPDTQGWNYLEDLVYWLSKGDSRIRGDLAGKSPEQIRKVLEDKYDKLLTQQVELERERDDLIQEAMLNYNAVAQELEARGSESGWARVREGAEKALEFARERMRLVECELNLAAGKDEGFRSTARAAIESGANEYTVRLMEASYFMQRGQPSEALRAARIAASVTGEGEEGIIETLPDGTERLRLTPAQHTIKQIELALLQHIDQKTISEADGVKKLCWSKLSEHGEPGFWGYIGDVLTIGVTGAVSAIGDKMDLRQNQFVSGTPTDKEDTHAGKPESQAREMGVMLDEASRAHLGMTMIVRFRQRNIPLDTIRHMTDEDFRQTVADEFGWDKMTKPQATKMRAAMMLAFTNPDTKRLLEWKPQTLDLEAGKQYLDTGSFEMTITKDSSEWTFDGLTSDAADILADAASVKNVALFLGPLAQIRAAGKATSFIDWAHPVATATNAGDIVTIKEAFATAIHLPELAQWAAEHKLGNRLMTEFVSLNARMGLLGKVGVDALVQWYAMNGARAATEYAMEFAGGSEEAQKEAGRIAELLAQAVTAYGVGDYDVASKLAERTVITPDQIRSLAQTLASALEHSDEMAGLARSYGKQLDDALGEVAASGQLPKNTQRLIGQTAEQLKEQLESVARRLASADQSPLVLAEYQRLKAVWQGLESLRDGMPGQAKAWKDFVDGLADELQAGRAAAQNQRQVCERLASQIENSVGSSPKDTLRNPMQALEAEGVSDFTKPSMAPHADKLAAGQEFTAARKAYGEALAVYEELGLGETPAAQELYVRLRHLEDLLAAQQHLKALGVNTPINQEVLAKIGPAELAAIKADPDLKLVPIGEGASDPYWVMLGTRRIGVFKPKAVRPDAQFPFQTEAEEIVPKLARELDIPAPASVRTTMKLGQQDVDGVLIRYVEGKALKDCTLAERVVLKKQIARDWVLRALVGDRDGHGGNFQLGPDGVLRPLDRNLSDFLDQEQWALDAVLGGKTVSTDPDLMPEQVKKLMLWRLGFAARNAQHPLYGCMVPILKQMTYEDFADTIRVVQTWDRAFLAKQIGNAFGDQTERVLNLMEARISVMKEVFEQAYPPIADVAAGSALRLDAPVGRGWTRTESSRESAWALPMAA